jgi:hypothetical protein
VAHPYRPGDRVGVRTVSGEVPGTVRGVYRAGPPRVYEVEADDSPGLPPLFVLESHLTPAAESFPTAFTAFS